MSITKLTYSIETVRKQLAPRGYLRAGVSLSNKLLVNGVDRNGAPKGVSVEIAKRVARTLGVDCQIIPYKGPGELVDAIQKDAWDIGNVGNQPERAKHCHFSPDYCFIEACFLVRDSARKENDISDIDVKGCRIASKARSAYTLWLEDNIKYATIVNARSWNETVGIFRDRKVDALAGLRPSLEKLRTVEHKWHVLKKPFARVNQCIGCKHGIPEAHAFLRDFVNESVRTGEIKSIIEAHCPSPGLYVSERSAEEPHKAGI